MLCADSWPPACAYPSPFLFHLSLPLATSHSYSSIPILAACCESAIVAQPKIDRGDEDNNSPGVRQTVPGDNRPSRQRVPRDSPPPTRPSSGEGKERGRTCASRSPPTVARAPARSPPTHTLPPHLQYTQHPGRFTGRAGGRTEHRRAAGRRRSPRPSAGRAPSSGLLRSPCDKSFRLPSSAHSYQECLDSSSSL